MMDLKNLIDGLRDKDMGRVKRILASNTAIANQEYCEGDNKSGVFPICVAISSGSDYVRALLEAGVEVIPAAFEWANRAGKGESWRLLQDAQAFDCGNADPSSLRFDSAQRLANRAKLTPLAPVKEGATLQHNLSPGFDRAFSL